MFARIVATAVALAWLVPAVASPAAEAERTLGLVKAWVTGVYDNAAQAESDLSDPKVPDDHKHRLMHQLFVPVSVPVPGIPGYLVFQQSSVDGSEDPEMITRVGLLQFLPDPVTGMVRQRELNFVDAAAWKNAHRTPQRLAGLTLDAFRVDPGCDFELRANAAGTEVQGPMPAGTCRFFSKGLNRELTADDAVWIRPAEYWFLGRFVDSTGAIMFGNASPEPVKLVRRQ
ncbi:MAG: chromophore lyase CpcT/CpeT [Chromatiales bacterium]|jgi:hypothetical protein|nr:chromophore lyase CpcT/CpeT [Chromatiales bacterium]